MVDGKLQFEGLFEPRYIGRERVVGCADVWVWGSADSLLFGRKVGKQRLSLNDANQRRGVLTVNSAEIASP
jgi:hypothetical protein